MYIYLPTKSNQREYLSYFPQVLRDKLSEIPEAGICEVRLSINRPVVIKYSHGRYFISNTGKLIKDINDAFICSRNILQKICENITEFSPYAYEEELKNAFITIRGGHRIGLAGEVKSGQIRNLSNISSINFRIAHEHKGIANDIFQYVYTDSRVKNTIILSPPMCGKTSMLRDLIRLLSEKLIKVGICDTRGEIAAVYDGTPNMDIGDADVITGVDKAIGMNMLLRCMSPDVIACDELGSHEDFKAVENLFHSGVSVIATAHAKDRHEFIKSLTSKAFNDSFDTIITLKGIGEISEVYHG